MWPDGKQARGIDVSHHRGIIDWDQVLASGVSFGIVKATDGSAYVDTYFDRNWSGMRQAGVIRGAYHYFRPDEDSVEQARHYLEVAGYSLYKTDLPPVLDFEAYPPAAYAAFKQLSLTKRINKVKSWLNTVSDATGRLPIIYTNQSTWQSVMENSEAFSHYPLWVANYGVSKPYVPADNWGGQGWTIWQFSASGEVPGVNNGDPPVDQNIFNGTLADLRDWLGIDGTRPTPPDITNHQMMWALILAAKQLGADLETWLAKANLFYLVNPSSNASRPYDDLAVEELPFSDAIKEAIQIAIDNALTGTMNPIYYMTNQQVVNAFYQASPQLGISGWELIQRAGLADLINKRDAYYIGATINDIGSLSSLEKKALLAVIDPDSLPIEPTDPVDPVEPEEPEDPEEPEEPEDPIEPGTQPYPGLTNQQMINAFYRMAVEFNTEGWTMISRAGLTAMASQRSAAYSGPAIEEMSGLSMAQRLILLEDMLSIWGSLQEETYPGLTNQNVINLFYKAAAAFNQSGWDWIKLLDMEYLATPNEMRSLPYRGPKFEEMTGLRPEQIQALLNVMPQPV
jgi:GH25 family lysozyme M1 (1,4-beta-N-acetylmuramidase)